MTNAKGKSPSKGEGKTTPSSSRPAGQEHEEPRENDPQVTNVKAGVPDRTIADIKPDAIKKPEPDPTGPSVSSKIGSQPSKAQSDASPAGAEARSTSRGTGGGEDKR